MSYFVTACKNYDLEYKTIIIGESRVGKTSIIKRLGNQQFSQSTISTVGIDFVNIFFNIENVTVKLQIWDTAGQERFRTITRSHFRNTKGIVLVFDLTNKESFEKLEYWMESLQNMKLDTEIIYLLGNKDDLLDEREVFYSEAKKFSDRNMIKYFETSAKNSDNLYDIFKSLAFDILDLNDINKMYKNKLERANNFVYVYNMPSEVYIPNENRQTKHKKGFRPFRIIQGKGRTLTIDKQQHQHGVDLKSDSKNKISLNCCKIQ